VSIGVPGRRAPGPIVLILIRVLNGGVLDGRWTAESVKFTDIGVI
jgi:hypothetical protein